MLMIKISPTIRTVVFSQELNINQKRLLQNHQTPISQDCLSRIHTLINLNEICSIKLIFCKAN